MIKEKLDKLYDKQFEEIGDLDGFSMRIITVGDDIASKVYVNNKIKLLKRLNCSVDHLVLPDSITQDELEDTINKKSFDFDGLLVQLPLPAHLEEPLIPAFQDVDGFNKNNYKVLPCTVQACLDIMDELYGDIKGKNIAVLGRSNIVGFPLIIELIKRSATVTAMNSHSQKVEDWSNFDIVVSATGQRFLTDVELNKVDLVIDVGIHRVDGKICGDIIRTNQTQDNITPVPFGVGRFTVLNVARNLKLLRS